MYLYIYMHVHIRTYIHAYIHVYVHTYIHTYIDRYIDTYIHTYIYTYVHTHIPISVCTHVRTHVLTMYCRYHDCQFSAAQHTKTLRRLGMLDELRQLADSAHRLGMYVAWPTRGRTCRAEGSELTAFSGCTVYS